MSDRTPGYYWAWHDDGDLTWPEVVYIAPNGNVFSGDEMRNKDDFVCIGERRIVTPDFNDDGKEEPEITRPRAEVESAHRIRPFFMVAVNDDGTATIMSFATEAERDDATLEQIWMGGRAVAPADEAEGCLNEARDNGVIRFEGDPSIYWFTALAPAVAETAGRNGDGSGDWRKYMNIKWWIARIVLFRWITGCSGEGFYKDKGGAWHICNRLGCH